MLLINAMAKSRPGFIVPEELEPGPLRDKLIELRDSLRRQVETCTACKMGKLTMLGGRACNLCGYVSKPPLTS